MRKIREKPDNLEPVQQRRGDADAGEKKTYYYLYQDSERGQSRNLVINHKYVVNKGRSGIMIVRLNRSKVGDEKKNTRLRD